ncbi:MAG: hypothetical protein CNE89_08625 [Sphingomonadaceae bacterium MED-G03]|nr:MAG: hypothetical protein CNE89_08625 [Sphingomonadaceae bacterium MED-G03]
MGIILRAARDTAAEDFSTVIARLRLTQREVCTLLGMVHGARGVVPDADCDEERIASVTRALLSALSLVEDDDLVGAWLRARHPRRGHMVPLEEAGLVEGDKLISFVLEPHPAELVAIVAERMSDRAQDNEAGG